MIVNTVVVHNFEDIASCGHVCQRDGVHTGGQHFRADKAPRKVKQLAGHLVRSRRGGDEALVGCRIGEKIVLRLQVVCVVLKSHHRQSQTHSMVSVHLAIAEAVDAGRFGEAVVVRRAGEDLLHLGRRKIRVGLQHQSGHTGDKRCGH